MPEGKGNTSDARATLARPMSPIKLEEFIEAASSAALRAMEAHALTPNPDDPGTSKATVGRPPVIWNPHIIVGLILRNELGGEVNRFNVEGGNITTR
jgi:hypothetical protein